MTQTINRFSIEPAINMCKVAWIYYKCNCLKGTNEEECQFKNLASRIRTHQSPIVDMHRGEWKGVFETAQRLCLEYYKGSQQLLDHNCLACDRKLAEEALTRKTTDDGPDAAPQPEK
jgi:hypothetical protein